MILIACCGLNAIISAVMAVVNDIVETDAVEVVGYGLVKPLPYEKSGAVSGSRAFIGFKFKTGYGSKAALGSFQYIAYSYLVGTSCKHIAAFIAAVGPQQTCFIEKRNYLFQIFFGYTLSVSNIFKRYKPLFVVQSEVVEHSQSVSALS